LRYQPRVGSEKPIVCRGNGHQCLCINPSVISDSQHPFGGQAASHKKWSALSFAPQSFDWFALSRMMTLQALF